MTVARCILSFSFILCISAQVLPQVPGINLPNFPSESNPLPPSNPPPSPSSGATPGSTASEGETDGAVVPDGESDRCVRDTSKPTPILGATQLSFALSVVLSAAGVGLASALYSIAIEWETEHEYEFLRYGCIIVARGLTFASIKTSAALVTEIVFFEAGESALDASGAFLTWASAVYVRIYYEAMRLNLAAVSISRTDTIWDAELKDYLSPAHTGERKIANQEDRQGAKVHTRESLTSVSDGSNRNSYLSIRQRIFGGRVDRKWVLFTAIFYTIVEMISLIDYTVQVMGYVASLTELPFSESQEAGQCGIRVEDLPVFLGLAIAYLLFLFTHQQSLVPILTIAATIERPRETGFQKFVHFLRSSTPAILILWVFTYLLLPLFQPLLEPIYLAGDITLFWYVLISPPYYRSFIFLLHLAYTVTTSGIGIAIIHRIRRTQKIANNLGSTEKFGVGNEEVESRSILEESVS